MDHRLAHGVFELRNVSTWNCSTIRSPWALSYYKPTSPHCFSRIFPIPCGTQVPMVNGPGTSRLCPGQGQMPALVSTEDPDLPTALSSCPEHIAAFCSVFMLLPAETRAGRRQQVSEFISCTHSLLGSDWAALTQGTGSASGSTSWDRPQAGSMATVWFDSESHPSACLKHKPHLALVCISLKTSKLFPASLSSFLTFQQKLLSSASFLPLQPVPLTGGRLGTVGGWEQGTAWLLCKGSLHWGCATLEGLEQNRSPPHMLASLWPCGGGLPGVKWGICCRDWG